MSERYQYLFGPVPSRRFGRSLGIDLIPMKTCTLDCIFCEVGSTTCRTMQRREYVPTDAVLSELDRWLDDGGSADVITLAGSGEPTLHTGFGTVLRAARARGQTTVLLSNGTLMTLPDVRRDAASADIVKLSLSAWDQESYDRLHHQGGGVDFERLVASYLSFRKEFKGQLWLEVFLVAGINDRKEDVQRIAELTASVAPDRIHLNTAVRPTAKAGVVAVPEKRLRQLLPAFGAHAEVASAFNPTQANGGRVDIRTVIDILARRPCTSAQLSASLDAPEEAIVLAITAALRSGEIRSTERNGNVYYTGA